MQKKFSDKANAMARKNVVTSQTSTNESIELLVIHEKYSAILHLYFCDKFKKRHTSLSN